MAKLQRTVESPSADVILTWLVNRLADHLEVPAEEIDPDCPFADFGIDSRTSVSLSGELETLVGRELTPTLVWDYPTVNAVVAHLAPNTISGRPTRSMPVAMPVLDAGC